jgi:hypothetical protein
MDGEQPMAWLKFSADHDHRVGSQTTAYLRGMRVRVTRLCAEIATGLKRAVEIPAPNRATAEQLARDPFAADLPDPAPQAAPGQPNAAAPPPQDPAAAAAASGPPAGSQGA